MAATFKDATSWRREDDGGLTILGPTGEPVMTYLKGEWLTVGRMEAADD